MRERLLWELRYRRDQFSIDAGIAKGRPLPDWYLQKPELLEGEEGYMRAFWDLSSERVNAGLTVGSIPWSKAIDYARFQGVAPDMLDPFWTIIRDMDDGFRSWNQSEHDRHVRMNRPSPTATRTKKRAS